ncbi:type I pantothenate kinase [Streptococcus danieliae]|nr:type I pantothenate kinase [Streptococcus danieliae]
MQEFFNYRQMKRENWSQLHSDFTKAGLTQAELDAIRSLNDPIELEEIEAIYLPLIHLLHIYKKNKEELNLAKGAFLGQTASKSPFIIGIAGSVAVGKSTTSRLLRLLLQQTYPELQVDLVTTDGFLYPNVYLEAQDMMHQKGFPQSYDMEKLLDFLDHIRNGDAYDVPLYSHESYDILSDQVYHLENTDILIVEGINLFQISDQPNLFSLDYFDFSIYIDAPTALIEQWYLERFLKLRDLAMDKPENYHHRFSQMTAAESLAYARHVWEKINLVNLVNYILPTRNRAQMILHKNQDHKIDKIYLKK